MMTELRPDHLLQEQMGQDRREAREALFSFQKIQAGLAYFEHSCEKNPERYRSVVGDCTDYHGAIALMNYAMVAASPWDHWGWYANLINYEARHKKTGVRASKVWIPALATPSMATCVSKYWREADLVVSDICQTPLEACKIRPGLLQKEKDRIFQADVRDVEELGQNGLAAKSVDMILTDSFLHQFPGDQKTTVLQNFSRVLVDSGVLVTTIRLADERGPGYPSSAEQQRGVFMDLFEQGNGYRETYGLAGLLTSINSATEFYRARRRFTDMDPNKIKELMERFFKSVGVLVTEPIFSLTYARYARVWASGPKI